MESAAPLVPARVYEERRRQRQQTAERLARREQAVGWARLTVVAVGLSLAAWWLYHKQLPPAWLLWLVVAFVGACSRPAPAISFR